MAMSDECALQLIEAYKNYPVLWDPKDVNYFKKCIKEDAWKRIAAVADQPEDACKRKIISLLASYRRERAKEKRSRGTGKGASEVYTSRWFAYEAFRFLEDRGKPRKRINTESTEILDDESKEDSYIAEGDVQIEQSQSFATPKTAKRAKTRQQDENVKLMSDAMEIMKSAAGRIRDSASSSNNEVTSFGNFIINKMSSYSPETRKGVEHAFFDILVKADRGYFERPFYPSVPPYFNNPQPPAWQNTNPPAP